MWSWRLNFWRRVRTGGDGDGSMGNSAPVPYYCSEKRRILERIRREMLLLLTISPMMCFVLWFVLKVMCLYLPLASKYPIGAFLQAGNASMMDPILVLARHDVIARPLEPFRTYVVRQ